MVKCSSCESGNREGVEELYRVGKSTREISKALEDKSEIAVGHVTVANHVKNPMSVEKMKKEDFKIAELEEKVRKFEILLSRAIPDARFLTWYEVNSGMKAERAITYLNAYRSTISSSETINDELGLIRRRLSEREHRTQEERQKQQQERSKAVIEQRERDKREAEKLKRLGSEIREREQIERMRADVGKYDEGHGITNDEK